MHLPRSQSTDSRPPSNGFGAGSNQSGVGGGNGGGGNGCSSGSTNSTKSKGRSSKNKRNNPTNEPVTATDLSQPHDAIDPQKIRRTPTIEQSPPHSISRTPEVIYSSSSSSGCGGGLKFGYEAQTPSSSATTATVVTNPLHIIATQAAMKDSPPSSPGSEGGNSKKRIKKQHGSTSSASTPTDQSGGSKLFQNGIAHAAAHMLGNSLNPNSSMAQKMSDTLNQEIEVNMANTIPEPVSHVGPVYPGKLQSVSQ